MNNISILDQIINNQKAEEVAKLDAVEIINNLFGELSTREKDILIRRFGLHGGVKETLESIGEAHKLTRERIRQIENSSVKKLQQLKRLDDYIITLKKIIVRLLEDHGGMVEREYLLDILVNFSLNGFNAKNKDEVIHKNYLNFLITKLLCNEFAEVINSKYFKKAYKLKYQDLDHLEEITAELLSAIRNIKEILTTEKLINLAYKLESFKRYQDKMPVDSGIDIAKILKFDFFKEKLEVVNANKPVYSILKAAKKIEQNKFGYWGEYNWREIKPRTINDKIYLILKNHEQPIHFVEIADHINKIGFDNKTANPATVHNELILDNKYILVGRGLYGLKEWGYKSGAVVDVIEDILSRADDAMTKDEIIEKVLDKRMVKKSTVVLALMDKDRFIKIDGKYGLKENE